MADVGAIASSVASATRIAKPRVRVIRVVRMSGSLSLMDRAGILHSAPDGEGIDTRASGQAQRGLGGVRRHRWSANRAGPGQNPSVREAERGATALQTPSTPTRLRSLDAIPADGA